MTFPEFRAYLDKSFENNALRQALASRDNAQRQYVNI